MREAASCWTRRAAPFEAPALVVATGGLSIPKMGATGIGYDIARQFGVKIQPCRPRWFPSAFQPGGPQSLRQSGRRLHRNHGVRGKAAVPRSHALHTSRTERPVHSPDLVIFECVAAHINRPRAQLQTQPPCLGIEHLAKRGCGENGVPRDPPHKLSVGLPYR